MPRWSHPEIPYPLDISGGVSSREGLRRQLVADVLMQLVSDAELLHIVVLERVQ